MLVVFNDSPKEYSKLARGIIGRYCWRIARDLWIWPTSGLRFDIIKDLEQCNDPLRILFFWKDNRKELGFDFYVFGELLARQSKIGLFNHLSEFKEFDVQKVIKKITR
jgi:hypothetical protein